MFYAGNCRERLILFGTPAVIILLGCGASLLPASAIIGSLKILTAWTGVSIPVAVLTGHCMLSESE